ncbi:alanine:cation symporter family protein, partial [Wenyingzhuangia sp. 1_MG-2023]|nr:alanine:cation symporter family protein [Wenyingzhuangia sp. 1_MG-2023]
GWSLYGERCAEYLFGVKAIMPFRIVWILSVPVGALISMDFVWLLADTLNALMAIPNLVALALLSPVVFRLAREYFNSTNSTAK